VFVPETAPNHGLQATGYSARCGQHAGQWGVARA